MRLHQRPSVLHSFLLLFREIVISLRFFRLFLNTSKRSFSPELETIHLPKHLILQVLRFRGASVLIGGRPVDHVVGGWTAHPDWSRRCEKTVLRQVDRYSCFPNSRRYRGCRQLLNEVFHPAKRLFQSPGFRRSTTRSHSDGTWSQLSLVWKRR